MGVNIKMDGMKISGNARILNNVKVSGKENDVNIGLKQSSFSGKSNVLNNLDVQNGELNVEMEDVHVGHGVNFMNNRTVKENSTKTQTQNDPPLTKPEQKPQEKQNKEKTKKVGLLKMLLNKFINTTKTTTSINEPAIIINRANHADFVAVISGNGSHKNKDVGVYDKLKEEENSKELNKEQNIEQENDGKENDEK